MQTFQKHNPRLKKEHRCSKYSQGKYVSMPNHHQHSSNHLLAFRKVTTQQCNELSVALGVTPLWGMTFVTISLHTDVCSTIIHWDIVTTLCCMLVSPSMSQPPHCQVCWLPQCSVSRVTKSISLAYDRVASSDQQPSHSAVHVVVYELKRHVYGLLLWRANNSIACPADSC